jgi:signal recognition particle receptor subunit beta
MVLVNYSGKEINAKVVYYGPGLCGKTTNLEAIYGRVPDGNRGKMVSMKTRTERTLFFDFLPLNLGDLAGFQTRFLLYTVPGQVYYNATRKLVLKGVDALVFVADSQRGKMDENIESFENLRENLREHGLDMNEIPLVLQYNKRDLPDVYSVEEMESALNAEGRWIYREASATSGAGVFETFKAIARLLLAHLSKSMGLKAQSGSTVRMVGADAADAADAPDAADAAAPGSSALTPPPASSMTEPELPAKPEPPLPPSEEPIRPMSAFPQTEMAPPPGLVNGPDITPSTDEPATYELEAIEPAMYEPETIEPAKLEPLSIEPTADFVDAQLAEPEEPFAPSGFADETAETGFAEMSADGVAPEEEDADDATAEMETPIQRPSVSMERPVGLESFSVPSTVSEPPKPADEPSSSDSEDPSEPFRPMSLAPMESSVFEPTEFASAGEEVPEADPPVVEPLSAETPMSTEPTLEVVPGMAAEPSSARVIRIPVTLRAEDLRDGVILEIAVEAEENGSNAQHG